MAKHLVERVALLKLVEIFRGKVKILRIRIRDYGVFVKEKVLAYRLNILNFRQQQVIILTFLFPIRVVIRGGKNTVHRITTKGLELKEAVVNILKRITQVTPEHDANSNHNN